MTPHHRRFLAVGLTVAVTLAGTTACAATNATLATETAQQVDTSDPSALWDQSAVHSISLTYDQGDYDDLIATYLDTGEKVWITATAVIDGVSYEEVGLKLKGNSTLRGLSTDADAAVSAAHPEDLPWIIDLDRDVDGQNADGASELVLRGNDSQTALNEAVALDLLAATGLAAEEAIAARVEVNGETSLRLVVENPDDPFLEREFEQGTALYKAESGGDYSYRGDDPAAYADVFDQEAGEDDLTPLIDFLRFINDSDDATFEAELSSWLDVDAFATYLAFQELVDNFDDIDGPGNNSYLAYDAGTGLMTVVSWDLNLAFGASPGGAGGAGGGMPGAGDLPDAGAGMPGRGGFGGDGQAPSRGETADDADPGAGVEQGGGMPGEGMAGGGGQGGGAPGGGGNILSERFLASDEFAALYEAELDRLTEVLYGSGLAEDALDAWVQTLEAGASDLVSASVIESEADALSGSFPE